MDFFIICAYFCNQLYHEIEIGSPKCTWLWPGCNTVHERLFSLFFFPSCLKQDGINFIFSTLQIASLQVPTVFEVVNLFCCSLVSPLSCLHSEDICSQPVSQIAFLGLDFMASSFIPSFVLLLVGRNVPMNVFCYRIVWLEGGVLHLWSCTVIVQYCVWHFPLRPPETTICWKSWAALLVR